MLWNRDETAHVGCERIGQALAFLVFSNCEEILVIMPRAATNDSRDSTCGRSSKLESSFVSIPVAGVCLPRNPPFLVVLLTSPRRCLYNMY
jgi:hypothetical protein